MTVGALWPLTALVHVIGQMAADTLCRGALIALSSMAGRAGDLAVLIGESEAGLVVIEIRLLPGSGLVAGSAISTEGATVRIVLAMTVDAARGRFTVRGAGTMACNALEGDMRVLQGEIGEVVGEARLAELVDVGVAAEVLRMAATALTGRGLLHSSVVAGLRPDVSSGVLVTVQAQGGLTVAIRTVVTVAALTFELGVRLADGTGHDELLDRGRACGRNEERGEQHEQQRLRQGP